MQSKSLLNYQLGYTGSVVDLEAIKPWERKCYLLGVWHVANASEPLVTSGSVVQAIRKMIREQTVSSRTCNHNWVYGLGLHNPICSECKISRD